MSELSIPKSACIVCFDDEQGLESPYGWDPECTGALSCSDQLVVFPNRRAAQRAIRISRAHAKLRQAQGGVVNTDWLPDCAGCIKIKKVVAA